MGKEILFSTCVLVNNKVYAFSSFGNLPMTINLENGDVIFTEDLINFDLFTVDAILSDDKNLYVFSIDGKILMKFGLVEKVCQYYEINCGKRDWDNYGGIAKYGKYIYIFPKYVSNIVKIDIESGEIKKDVRLYIDLDRNRIIKQKETFYFSCSFQCDNIVWLLNETGNWLVKYDMERERWIKYRLSINLRNCVHMVEYNGAIYILNSEGIVYRWNIKEKFLEILADCRGENKYEFIRIAVTDKKVFLLPSLGKKIYMIILETRKVELYCDYPINFQYYNLENWSKYYGYCENDESYFFAMRSAFFVLQIDKRDGQVRWIELDIPSYDEYISAYIKYNNVILEEDFVLNSLFIARKPENTKFIGNNSIIGNDIWKKLKAF